MEDMFNYHKLNDANHKDHFPLSFIDQIFERLLGHAFWMLI